MQIMIALILTIKLKKSIEFLDEFNTLKKAASGGRGRRGTKLRKKPIDFNAASDKYKWPGFNTPLGSTKLGKQKPISSTEDESEESASVDPKIGSYQSMTRKSMPRGWTGFGYGGRSLGSPAAPDGSKYLIKLNKMSIICIKGRHTNVRYNFITISESLLPAILDEFYSTCIEV